MKSTYSGILQDSILDTLRERQDGIPFVQRKLTTSIPQENQSTLNNKSEGTTTLLEESLRTGALLCTTALDILVE